MALIVLVHNKRPLLDLLTINLKTFTGSEVISREDAQDALNLLELLPVDLIISEVENEHEKTAQKISEFLKRKNIETPIILFGKGQTAGLPEGLPWIENSDRWEEIIKLTSKILGVDADEVRRRVSPEFVSIPVRYFLLINYSLCDVYIRIKKGPEEFQYIKRLHKGDNYTTEVIERYLQQGLKDFYIPKEFEVNFTNFASDQLVLELEKSHEHIDATLQVIAKSYDFAINETKRLGFTPATIQLTDTIISSMIKTFEKSPQLSTLLHKIINQKSSYMYQHCHMIAMLSSECLASIGMATNDNLKLFGYAAFFHDIELVDQDELAKIQKNGELETLPKYDRELLMNHALDASLLLQKHPEAPLGVHQLILLHHGSLDGRGFLDRFSVDLSLNARIFIVCESFANKFLTVKESAKEIHPIITDLYAEFVDPEMIEVVKMLEQALSKKQKRSK